MKNIAISVDQLARRQPGGIGTYVRGLLEGLADVAPDVRVTAVGPRGSYEVGSVAELRQVAMNERLLTATWRRWPVGVPRDADVVHATSFAGPFGGGARGRVQSMTIQDLLWRDQPELTTRRGRAFHEDRLAFVRCLGESRIFVTTPRMRERLIAVGFRSERLHLVTLGVDQNTEADLKGASALLAEHKVEGSFTLVAGTIEPRKNLERLATAHAAAREQEPNLGPLVVVGPRGWGQVHLESSVEVGSVSTSVLAGLRELAQVVAYVPLEEGWGLPPLEALAAGARVVVSSTTPSTADRTDVVHVDPYSTEDITRGLLAAIALPLTSEARAERRNAVASYSWSSMAQQHLDAWR